METNSTNISYTTAEDYLQGCVGYTIPQEAITTIFIDNGIEPGEEACNLTTKQKDFLKVSVYRYVLNSPSMTSSVTDINGVWQHKEGATERNKIDTEGLRAEIKRILKKYGISSSTISVQNMGMRVWSPKGRR